MINFIKFIIFFIFYCNQAYSDELVNLRFGSNAENKRIVLDLKKDVPFDHRIDKNIIEIIFKKKISINSNVKAKENLDSISFNKQENMLVLKFKRNIFNTNIYLLKKQNFIQE